MQTSSPSPSSATPVPTRSAPKPGDVVATLAPTAWYSDDVVLGDELPGRFTAIGDAIAAARSIADAFKSGAETRLPLFRTKVASVQPIAVLAIDGAFTLHRTRGSSVDPWDRQDGYLFKRWVREPGRTSATRTDATLAALVGWSRVARFDTTGDTASFTRR